MAVFQHLNFSTRRLDWLISCGFSSCACISAELSGFISGKSRVVNSKELCHGREGGSSGSWVVNGVNPREDGGGSNLTD